MSKSSSRNDHVQVQGSTLPFLLVPIQYRFIHNHRRDKCAMYKNKSSHCQEINLDHQRNLSASAWWPALMMGNVNFSMNISFDNIYLSNINSTTPIEEINIGFILIKSPIIEK